jgi:hypothetical protein
MRHDAVNYSFEYSNQKRSQCKVSIFEDLQIGNREPGQKFSNKERDKSYDQDRDCPTHLGLLQFRVLLPRAMRMGLSGVGIFPKVTAYDAPAPLQGEQTLPNGFLAVPSLQPLRYPLRALLSTLCRASTFANQCEYLQHSGTAVFGPSLVL